MRDRAIAQVEIDFSGRLLIRPRAESDSVYEYIYREANGLRWDREKHALCAYEPARWGYEELLRHIAATLRDCMDEELRITEQTAWVGVSLELQHLLRQALSQGLALQWARRLTLRCTRRPTAGCARFRPRVNSNVRPQSAGGAT